MVIALRKGAFLSSEFYILFNPVLISQEINMNEQFFYDLLKTASTHFIKL